MTSIQWKPTVDLGAQITAPDVDAFARMMDEAGFTLPCTLGDEDLPVLRAMAAVYHHPTNTHNPFKELVQLICQHDSIDVWKDEA